MAPENGLEADFDAGVDAVDAASASMAGTTSQPPLSALVSATDHSPRETGLSLAAVNALELASQTPNLRRRDVHAFLALRETLKDLYGQQGDPVGRAAALRGGFGAGRRSAGTARAGEPAADHVDAERDDGDDRCAVLQPLRQDPGHLLRAEGRRHPRHRRIGRPRQHAHRDPRHRRVHGRMVRPRAGGGELTGRPRPQNRGKR